MSGPDERELANVGTEAVVNESSTTSSTEKSRGETAADIEQHNEYLIENGGKLPQGNNNHDDNDNDDNHDYQILDLNPDFKALLDYIDIFSNPELFLTTYGFKLPDYLKDRKVFSDYVLQIADELEKLTKNTGKAKIVTGSSAIASGALTLGGLILAPVTAGASLVVTGFGMAGGIASGAASAGNEIYKNTRIKKANARINEMKDTFNFREEILVNIFEDFKKLSEEVKKLDPDTLTTLMQNYQYGRATYYTYYVAGASGIAVPGMAGLDFLGKMGGSSLVAIGGTTAQLFSSSIAVLNIGAGTWDLIKGIDDQNRSEISESLRIFCDEYNRQTAELVKFFDGLKKKERSKGD